MDTAEQRPGAAAHDGGWESVQILVLGADAGDRARVREVLREHRVLAFTNDRADLEIRLAVRGGRVAAAAPGGEDPVEGPTCAELRARIADGAPRAVVLDGAESDVPGADGEIVRARDEAGTDDAELPREAMARWAADERADAVAGTQAPEGGDDEALVPSVVVTDAAALDVLDEARRTRLTVAVLPLADDTDLRLLAYRAPAGEGVWLPGTSLALAAEDPARGVDLLLLTPWGDRQWSPGELTALSLPGVDVRAGALGRFLDAVVGPGAVAADVTAAFGGRLGDSGAVTAAVDAPPSQQADRLVEALGLPEATARLLRGEITPEAVAEQTEGARVFAVDGVLDAGLELFAQELDEAEDHGGLLAAYRALVVDHPRLLAALIAAEAGVGAVLAGGTVRAGTRGPLGRGATVRGVLGGLLLADAAAEGLLSRELRQRLRGRR